MHESALNALLSRSEASLVSSFWFVLGPNLVSLKGNVNVRRVTAVIYQ